MSRQVQNSEPPLQRAWEKIIYGRHQRFDGNRSRLCAKEIHPKGGWYAFVIRNSFIFIDSKIHLSIIKWFCLPGARACQKRGLVIALLSPVRALAQINSVGCFQRRLNRFHRDCLTRLQPAPRFPRQLQACSPTPSQSNAPRSHRARAGVNLSGSMSIKLVVSTRSLYLSIRAAAIRSSTCPSRTIRNSGLPSTCTCFPL